VSWRNPDPHKFLEAIEAKLVSGRNYAQSFIVQKLRLPAATGAARPVTIIALDTNQTTFAVGAMDTLRNLSPGSIGHVKNDQIRAVEALVEEARRAGEIVVFARHHNWPQLSAGSKLRLAAVMRRLDVLINPQTVAGARYDAVTQQEIGTEEFPSAA